MVTRRTQRWGDILRIQGKIGDCEQSMFLMSYKNTPVSLRELLNAVRAARVAN